jgi:hypothetical protein
VSSSAAKGSPGGTFKENEKPVNRGEPAPLPPHEFRHAHLRRIVRHTKSLARAQKQAGWARLHTQYLSLSDDEARVLMEGVPE